MVLRAGVLTFSFLVFVGSRGAFRIVGTLLVAMAASGNGALDEAVQSTKATQDGRDSPPLSPTFARSEGGGSRANSPPTSAPVATATSPTPE